MTVLEEKVVLEERLREAHQLVSVGGRGRWLFVSVGWGAVVSSVGLPWAGTHSASSDASSWMIESQVALLGENQLGTCPQQLLVLKTRGNLCDDKGSLKRPTDAIAGGGAAVRC